MSRPIDLVIGKIEEMHEDKCAGWEAFYKKDYENEMLREEIAELKQKVRNLQRIVDAAGIKSQQIIIRKFNKRKK
jgi:hypothetical protein